MGAFAAVAWCAIGLALCVVLAVLLTDDDGPED